MTFTGLQMPDDVMCKFSLHLLGVLHYVPVRYQFRILT